jgi:nucleotide-binding universal stress UspA family protein
VAERETATEEEMMDWLPKQTIVVPIDFSDESFKALDEALRMVQDASHVHVIHVLADLSPVDPAVVWKTTSPEVRTQHVETALRSRLTDPKYKGLNYHVGFADPGHEIVDLAQRLEADLIVMPSHGRTGLKRLLIGSVAERVVRLAHCPVVVLRG